MDTLLSRPTVDAADLSPEEAADVLEALHAAYVEGIAVPTNPADAEAQQIFEAELSRRSR